MTPETDLFGDPPQQRRRGGYAGDPGRGPAGETCKTCRHCFTQGDVAGTYYKCAMGNPTRSSTTDIRVRTPACQHWEGA